MPHGLDRSSQLWTPDVNRLRCLHSSTTIISVTLLWNKLLWSDEVGESCNHILRTSLTFSIYIFVAQFIMVSSTILDLQAGYNSHAVADQWRPCPNWDAWSTVVATLEGSLNMTRPGRKMENIWKYLQVWMQIGFTRWRCPSALPCKKARLAIPLESWTIFVFLVILP